MKKKTVIIMLVFFLIGLLILLYPSLSNLYNEKYQTKAIKSYEKILVDYSKEKNKEEIKRANDYNNELNKQIDPFYNYKKLENYNDILNITDTGMMGYIHIPKIDVELSIYHGTSDEVLSKSVGHLEGSSLPVGGIGTHSVLSAHRGLPSSKLFTDLDKLEIGDIFTITILQQQLTYQVDEIKVIKPTEIKYLAIDKEKDYVTLMTCTPYGINTHRLLVRGIRITGEAKTRYITTEAFKISNIIVTSFIAAFIIIALLLIVVIKPVNKNKNIIDKYIYPSKMKKEFGGRKYAK